MLRSASSHLIGGSVILLIVLAGVEGEWVPCLDGVTRIMESPTARTLLTNWTVSVVPRAADGILHPTSYVSFAIRGFQELRRPAVHCYESATKYPITGDEGAMVQPYTAILIEDLMCEYIPLYKWYYEGIELQTVRVEAKHALHTNFSLQLNVTLPSESFRMPEYHSTSQNLTYYASYQYVTTFAPFLVFLTEIKYSSSRSITVFK